MLAVVTELLRPGGQILIEMPSDDDEVNSPDHFHGHRKRQSAGAVRRCSARVQSVSKGGVRANESLLPFAEACSEESPQSKC